MEQEHKEELTKIIITLVAFAIVFACDKIFDLATVFPGPFGWVFPFVLFFAIYVFSAHEILAGAAKHIVKGKVFDEHFLMAIASLGAFALGIYKGVNGMSPDGFEEGCAIVIFYNIGEFFQDLAVDNSRDSIEKLMDIRPDTAGLVLADGTVNQVDPAKVAIGDIVEVCKGEKIPLDGIITEGSPVIDMMALTGESAPLKAEPGIEILSGSINIGDPFRFRVTKPYGESTVSKILELVEHASEKKTRTENFIDRFASIYTPIVVILCVLLAVVPSLITGEWNVWIYRALSFLVVSCPCALVISVPLCFFTGIGRASRDHILVKGSNYLEMISKAKTFVCDKTGTLTVGRRTSADDDAADPVKPEAKEFVSTIKQGGARIAMLSGDREDVAKSVADELGITWYKHGLLPQEKYDELEKIMNGSGEKDIVCYIGDGINDAPSLMASDVGISMGSIGTDAAVEASDIVLMQDNLLDILKLRRIARKTMRIAKENLIFSIAVKVAILILSALGITSIWYAIFGDVGVAILAILNALRAGTKRY